MFSVLFEVHPHPDQWDAYLGYAKLLRPELEQIDGFVDNIRYKSLTREGWILSLSSWRDEKAVVRWRTLASHHRVQEEGRTKVLLDYHLRVGQITADTQIPAGQVLKEQRLDETEVGEGTAVALVDFDRIRAAGSSADIATSLGLSREAPGLVAWDVYEAVLTPGQMISMSVWRDGPAAEAVRVPQGARSRLVRVVRDYTMFDRREAPQYYPDARRTR
jgi:heme-degrading monooxygenase HmoA